MKHQPPLIKLQVKLPSGATYTILRGGPEERPPAIVFPRSFKTRMQLEVLEKATTK